MSKETWKDIDGTGGRFQISNKARVRSIAWQTKTRFIPGKLRKIQVNNGYKCIQLKMIDGTFKKFNIHRLVAIAFIPNDDPLKKCINHKNGIKTDNRINNLEWCTMQENILHGKRILKSISQIPQFPNTVIDVNNAFKHKGVVFFGKKSQTIIKLLISGEKIRLENHKKLFRDRSILTNMICCLIRKGIPIKCNKYFPRSREFYLLAKDIKKIKKIAA